MPQPLTASTHEAFDVLLDIPTEEHLVSASLGSLPRPGDHVRITFVDKSATAGESGHPKRREFRVDRVTFSGTLERRRDRDWRGGLFATIVEVTEVPVNKAFLPRSSSESSPRSAPAESAPRLIESAVDPRADDDGTGG